MFKTNSRKGLSLASIVALTASLFAGVAPAQASSTVSLETAKGTTYAALAGTTFELTVNAGSSIPSSSWITLKTRIARVSGASYSATVSATTGATFNGAVTDTQSATIISAATVSTTLSAHTVAISTATSVSNGVYTVQSWLDSDGDGVIDSGETQSELRTITFFRTADIGWTTTFTAPVLSGSAQTLSAVVSTTEGINMAQLAANKVQVAFATVSGTAYTALGTSSSQTAGVFSAGENTSVPAGTNTRRANLANITVAASSTYVAVAVVDGIEVGGEQYAVVGSAAVSAIEKVVVTEGANTVQSDSNVVSVRAGVTAPVTLTADVSRSAGVAAAAGTLVTVTVTEVTLTSVSAVVGGGKTLANLATATESIDFTVAVNASGKVSVPLTANLRAGQVFTVQLSNGNAVSAVTTVSALATAFGQITDLTTFGSGSVVRVTSGTATTLTYAVLDNFKQPLTGDFRVYLSTNNGSVTVSAPVTGANVTFSVTPTRETQYTAKVQSLNTSTLVFDDVANGAAAARTIFVGASNAAAGVTLVATSQSNLALNNAALAAVDTRTGAKAPTLTTGHRATLSGQVTDANGIATYGRVTLSAPNVMFSAGGVFSLGSITVETSATGAYADVAVYSNRAGNVTVSATVGAATRDLRLTFVAAADTAGARWIVTAPATAVPGTTAQFKAQLVDTWSNPVQVTTTSKIALVYTGPGFVTGALPTTTNANGELSFSVLFGSNDAGSVTVTYAYDGDSTVTTTADNIAASSTTVVAAPVVVAPEVNAVIGSFNGRVAVRVENAKGAVVSVKIGARWFKYTSLNDNYLFTRKSVTGRTVPVAVYVNGTLENVATITVK